MLNNNLWAKKNETIQQHYKKLLQCLEVLKNIGYINDDRLYSLCQKACIYHDYGKVNPEFQKRVHSALKLKFDEDKEIAHNILSMFFIDKSEFEDKDYLMLLFAVGFHHNYCDVLETLTKAENSEKFKTLLAEYKDVAKKPKRKDLKELGKIFVDKESILLKGFLHKCDYCASSNIGVKNVEIPNNFLANKMELLLNKWRSKVPKASWNDMQNFCQGNSDKNIIVIAQTGMGKTEGALKWIGNSKGFFVLPLRTAINAMYKRIKSDVLDDVTDEKLAVLHSESIEFLLEFQEDRDIAEVDDILFKNSLAKSLSMPLTITTMDQLFDFVFRYSGYEMKLTTFSYSKIVIDEIQMYGADLLSYLIRGIEMITSMGGKVAIITATLPPFISDILSEKCDFEMPKIFTTNIKRHNVEVIKEKINTEKILEVYFKNKKENKPNKILVICNTIKKAQQLYDEIFSSVKDEDKENINQLHTRFIKDDRSKLEAKILKVGKTYDCNNNIIVANEIWITTSVVEASLDIDFDYLFTELQDLSSLFQRMGRCNRKGVKPVDYVNCFVYTEIDSGLLKVNNKGFIDKTIYSLSKEAVLSNDFRGVVSENKKIELIETYFTTEKVKNSDFYREFTDLYDKIKNLLEPYSKHTEDFKQKFRNISSKDVIPKSIYDVNNGYEDVIAKIKTESDPLKKIKLMQIIKKDIVSIPAYENPSVYEKIELNRYTKIDVVECEYSNKKGYKTIKQDSLATFW